MVQFEGKKSSKNLKFKRKNNPILLFQSVAILTTIFAAMFANFSLAAAPVLSHHVMIPADNSSSNLYISSSQVHSLSQSEISNTSLVQSAASSAILPSDQITLQKSESIQENAVDSSLVINAQASLLEQPANQVEVSIQIGNLSQQSLAVSSLKSNSNPLSIYIAKTLPVFQPFALSNSVPQTQQAMLPVNIRQQNSLAAENNSNKISLNYSNTQTKSNLTAPQAPAISVEVLKC